MTYSRGHRQARNEWLALSKEVRAALVGQARRGEAYPDPETTRLALAQVRRDKQLARNLDDVIAGCGLAAFCGTIAATAYLGGRINDAPLWFVAFGGTAFGVLAFAKFAGVRVPALGWVGLASGLPVKAEDRWSAELGVPVDDTGPKRSRVAGFAIVAVLAVLALAVAVVLVDLLDRPARPVDALKKFLGETLFAYSVLAVVLPIRWAYRRIRAWVRRRSG